MRLLRPSLAVLGIVVIVFVPLHALAEQIQPTNIVKSSKEESFSLPYQAANRDNHDPFIYKFDKSKGLNWIFTIDDKLSYIPNNQSKVVVTLKEADPSPKFIQIFLYGGNAQKFAVAVNTKDTGYQIIYSKDVKGWVNEQPVTLTNVDNAGLTVTDGKRIVVDNLNTDGFDLASIQIYGKDETGASANAYGGSLELSTFSGDISGTPMYYVPAAVMVGFGALLGVLLYKKKRT